MENTTSAVPTTHGYYIDRVDQLWRLNAGGWYCASGWSTDDVRVWAPFTRLYTLKQAMNFAYDVVLGEGAIFDHDSDNAFVATRLEEIGEGEWPVQ